MSKHAINYFFVFVTTLVVFVTLLGNHHVRAESVRLQPSKDTTLYEYDPADPDSLLNSNGSGDFFSAGRTRSRGLLRRGLLQFDFSAIPTDAVVIPGTVELQLEVVDSPTRDTSGEERDFWLVPVAEEWSEGDSVANAGISGAGSGAPASVGDATWLHAIYDPAVHVPGATSTDGPGYWRQVGVIGNSPVDPLMFGDPSGTVPAAPYLGPVTFASSSLEADINAWLHDDTANFGWLILGDERIAGNDVSSARGFTTREHNNPPTLSFQYAVVPEPQSFVLLAISLVAIGTDHRKKRPTER